MLLLLFVIKTCVYLASSLSCIVSDISFSVLSGLHFGLAQLGYIITKSLQFLFKFNQCNVISNKLDTVTVSARFFFFFKILPSLPPLRCPDRDP